MIKAHKDGNLRPISIRIGIYSDFIVDWCLGIADRWCSSCGWRYSAILKLDKSLKENHECTSTVVVTVVIVLFITVVGRS